LYDRERALLVGQQPRDVGEPLVGLWAQLRTADAEAAHRVAMLEDAHAPVTHLRRVAPYEAVLHLAGALRCFQQCDRL